MNSPCLCFGVATAAKVPVKRYNLLVPAAFPVVEPPPDHPVSIGTDRNIKRLAEYLERNEHRIPKVSRRLARRLHDDLSHNRMGFVGVAAAAYSHLVGFEDGRFARLYAKELVEKYPAKKRHFYSLTSRPYARLPPESAHLGSVIGALLVSSDELAQRWGLDLLIEFIKIQNSAEFIMQLEAFVPLLCGKASGKRPVPVEPVPSVAAASLHALLEHLRLCSRISFVSTHLDSITYTVLNVAEAQVAAAGLPQRRERQDSLLPQPSIGAQVGSAHSVGLAAVLVYEEMCRMTADAAEGRKVVEFLLRYLDAEPTRWEAGAAVQAGLGMLRVAFHEPQQRYLVASMLLMHAGRTKTLGPFHRAAVLSQAMPDVESLDPGAAAAAALLALRELPQALIAGEESSDATSGSARSRNDPGLLRDKVNATIRALCARLGRRPQLTSVLGAALGHIDDEENGPRALAALQCCVWAAEGYADLPRNADMGLGKLTPADHLSDVMLRAALGICLKERFPEQRILAHRVLQTALSAVEPGAYVHQAELIYSALFHEVAFRDATPDELIAMANTFGRVLAGANAPQSRRMACMLALQVQEQAIAGHAGEGRLAQHSSAQRHLVLQLCRSMWQRLSEVLQCPDLLKLQPEQSDEIGGATRDEPNAHGEQEERKPSVSVSNVNDEYARKVLRGAKMLDLGKGEDELSFTPFPAAAVVLPGWKRGRKGPLSEPARRFIAAFEAVKPRLLSEAEDTTSGEPAAFHDTSGELPLQAAEVEKEKGTGMRTATEEVKTLKDVLREVEAALQGL